MNISPHLEFIIYLAKAQSMLARLFDNRLGQGIGWNDFIILHQLFIADGQKMRRIDLAGRVGLTASGITKLLAPMEKIGLVGRESNPRDARVSLVTLAPGGLRIYTDTLERAELLAKDALPQMSTTQLAAYSAALQKIS